MKPINEIRIRLCALACMILLPLCEESYPSGSGWFGLFMMMCVYIIGVSAGCFITNFLIVFKKWWKE